MKLITNLKNIAKIIELSVSLAISSSVQTDVTTAVEPQQTHELKAIEATAYCVTGTCADGTQTQENSTAAMAKEYIDADIYVWLRNPDDSVGDYLGAYEVHDTGSNERIKAGTVVDIYMPDYNTCIEFGRQNVYVHIVQEGDKQNATQGLPARRCRDYKETQTNRYLQ